MRTMSMTTAGLARKTADWKPTPSRHPTRVGRRPPGRQASTAITWARAVVETVKKAAKELVKERFLLQQDADAFIGAAEASDVLK